MNENNDEIDLIELLKKIYLERKLILKTSILAALFGVFYALFQPNQFTSSTTFIPQLSSGVKTGGSSLSGLASLAGINIGSMESSSQFPPTLYPQVVNGIPFRLDLLSTKIKLDNKTLTVRDYFSEKKPSFDILATLKKYTIGLPSLILGSFNNQKVELVKSDIFSITAEDKNMFTKLEKILTLSINENEGFITISSTHSNKYFAAQLTQIAQSLLQDKIIEFKNKSSREMLDFAMKQYSEKKEFHEKLQDKRAVFVDKNINISSSLFQNKLSRIESEVNISESILQQLASQLEQAKLQVNKDTPVFTTIKPVTIPFLKSSPLRKQIVVFFLFLGFIFSCGYVILKEPANAILKSLKS